MALEIPNARQQREVRSCEVRLELGARYNELGHSHRVRDSVPPARQTAWVRTWEPGR
jgi:hypothetical protein